MGDFLISQELRGWEQDKKKTQAALSSYQHQMAEALKNEMGEDIQKVMKGELVVKLSFWEKMKYRCKYILDKIFKNI